MSERDEPTPEGSSAELARKIARHHARRDRARREPVGNLWRLVARVGTLGWMIVLPIAAGGILGHLLDRRLGSGITWALAFITLGIAAGGYSVWRVIDADASGGDDEPDEGEPR